MPGRLSMLPPGFRSVRDAAKHLGVSVSTVRNYIRTGKLRAERHPNGRDVIIHEESLQTFWPYDAAAR